MVATITTAATSCVESPTQYEGWELVWNEEFNNDGAPDPESWSYERGFVRNNELQWYQEANAICKGGRLIIEGRQEELINDKYDENGTSWRTTREKAHYTAASIHTRDKREFLYGRFEVRAKIPTSSGAWPAIWTLGKSAPWPSCGEIDMLEYYQVDGVPHILANVAHGNDRQYNAVWDSERIPYSYFTQKDHKWGEKFHVWRMDWDEEAIRLYLDDELLNETLLINTVNGSIGNYSNPFNTPQYILLNLAMGSNGGEIDDSALPMIYEVDYVRIYQRSK
ncbi:MAG: glycoside hydrolase family 16 protein [Rikenellaceae bacterium]